MLKAYPELPGCGTTASGDGTQSQAGILIAQLKHLGGSVVGERSRWVR